MTSCSSTVSVAVTKSPNSDASRSKSCDSVCTTNSSCYLQRRKAKNPLMYPIRPNYSKSTSNITNSVRQRVLSAKLLKLRSIQSQLNDANFHLSELSKENQILKTLQKRQDKALSKYENTSADLPRLLRSHEEQLRAMTEKNKVQRLKIKELNDILKIREDELSKTQEKLSHLEKLNKDKRLIDKEKMFEQIEDLKLKLHNADELNIVLNRKLALETKAAKQRLNNEAMKVRQSQKELTQAFAEIDRLTAIIEARDNVAQPRKNRFNRLPGQSVSMVALNSLSQHPKSRHADHRTKLSCIVDTDSEDIKSPVTNVKLEPIKCLKTEETSKKSNDILTLPSECIKNRLSSSSKSRESGESDNGSDVSLGVFDTSGDEKSRSDSDYRSRTDDRYTSELRSKSADGGKEDVQSDYGEERVVKLNANLDAAIQKAVDNIDSEFEKKIGSICSNVVANVRTCSERLEAQKESLKSYKKDTNIILETFAKTEKMENKLKESFANFDPLDDDFIKEMFADDFKINVKKDKNANLSKNNKFGAIDRKKLLNTLKAIDAGDSIESIDELPTHNTHNLREVNELIG